MGSFFFLDVRSIPPSRERFIFCFLFELNWQFKIATERGRRAYCNEMTKCILVALPGDCNFQVFVGSLIDDAPRFWHESFTKFLFRGRFFFLFLFIAAASLVSWINRGWRLLTFDASPLLSQIFLVALNHAWKRKSNVIATLRRCKASILAEGDEKN